MPPGHPNAHQREGCDREILGLGNMQRSAKVGVPGSVKHGKNLCVRLQRVQRM